VERYVIANTGRVVLVLVNFQNKLLQCKLLDYILIGIPRVAIWNVAAKCYESKLKGLSNETTLVLSNTRELDRVPSTE